MSRKRRRKKSFGISSVFRILRLGALVGPGAVVALQEGKDWSRKAKEILYYYTGFGWDSQKFSWEALKKGWTPFVATTLITYGVQKIGGLIRRL